MRSGAIVRKVELWKKNVTRNSFGEQQEDWYLFKKIRAYTHMRSGRQTIDNDEVFDTIKIRLQVRNQHDIKEFDRIKYQGNMYVIDFIQLDLTTRWLTISCERLNE